MSPDFKRTPLNSLPQTHGEPLQHALSNFYSREYVKRTLAEIVDGVPARDDYLQFYGKRRDGFDQNKDPSAQAVSLVDDYLATSFCPQSLKVVALAVQAYGDTVPGSRPFYLRLLEMTALALHEMAAQVALTANGGVGINRLPPPPLEQDMSQFLPDDGSPPFRPLDPTDLFHHGYQDHADYPHGVASMVGYWAEWAIFGGVVLFHRGESGEECNDAFIHPCGGLIIFQMSEGQLCDFVNFATADRTQSALWPFPFRADKHARRLEPQTSMDKGIDVFRQRYERRRPPDPVRHQCVSRTANHPEWEGVVRAMSDARVRGGDIVKASKKFHREFKAEKEAYHAKNDELKRRYPS